jgi:hypothetical protein
MVQLRDAGAFLLTRTSVRTLPVTRQCPFDQEAAAMAEFARFRTVSGPSEDSPTDKDVTVGNGPGATSERPFRIDLPDLIHQNRGTVLMFQVSGTAGSHLKMVNQPKVDAPHPPPKNEVIDLQLDGTFTQPRSWHEIVQSNKFSEEFNELTIKVTDTPTGQSVTVSDVVLLYHAQTTP